MEPPNVLNLQLLRYVYDMTTWTKKKLKSKIKLSKTITVPRKDNDGKDVDPEEVRVCKGRSLPSYHFLAAMCGPRHLLRPFSLDVLRTPFPHVIQDPSFKHPNH